MTGKVNFHWYLASQFYPTHENFMHTKITWFLVYPGSISLKTWDCNYSEIALTQIALYYAIHITSCTYYQ